MTASVMPALSALLRYLPWVGWALVLVVGWLWLGSRDRVAALEVKLDVQVSHTQEAADANASNLVTIETLRRANQSLVDERKADTARTQAELEKRAQAVSQWQQEATRLKRERDAIIRNDSACNAHGQAVFADSCPALAERLRERSRSQGSH